MISNNKSNMSDIPPPSIIHPPSPALRRAPLIGVHGATHYGLAQAIGWGHKDHVFEAALRVQREPDGLDLDPPWKKDGKS